MCLMFSVIYMIVQQINKPSRFTHTHSLSILDVPCQASKKIVSCVIVPYLWHANWSQQNMLYVTFAHASVWVFNIPIFAFLLIQECINVSNKKSHINALMSMHLSRFAAPYILKAHLFKMHPTPRICIIHVEMWEEFSENYIGCGKKAG